MKRVHGWSLLLGITMAVTAFAAYGFWMDFRAPPDPRPQSEIIHTAPSNISYQQLPREAQDIINNIKARGTFAYKQDGKVFQNRERRLPLQKKGYYQEYTVVTPGANNRGARRIIAGKGRTNDVSTSGEYYYTSDHYRSFYQVKEPNE